jgi:hypothetical protein
MKSLLRWPSVLALALAVGCLTVAWRLPPAPAGPPLLEVDRDDHDWGRVAPGAAVNTTFVLRNRGGETLTLGEMKTSCGCTKPDLPVHSIPPGGKTTLSVGFHVPATPGRVRHFVRIPTNVPGRETVELSLFADAWIGVRPSPEVVDLGRLRPGEQVERTIQLFSPDHERFQIGRVSADSDAISASSESPGVALPVHRVLVSYRAGAGLGRVRGAVRVVTDRLDASVIDVPLGGEIIGPVSISPSFLVIERDEIGTDARRTLMIRPSEGGRQVVLNSAKVSGSWELLDRTTKVLPGGGLAMDVQIRFPKGVGTSSGELLLEFDTPGLASFRVPLMVRGWEPPPGASSLGDNRAVVSEETP